MPTVSMFDPDALSHKLLKAIGPIDSEDIDIEADCSQMGTTKSVYVEIEADLTPAALSPISFSSEPGNTTSGPQWAAAVVAAAALHYPSPTPMTEQGVANIARFLVVMFASLV